MSLICGIDEAGRGPVIGPLVMAGVLIDSSDLIRLKNIGVKDSKLLTKQKRDELFEQVKEIVKSYEVIVVEPSEIDDALNSDELNLNWLEAHKAADIITKLKPSKVTVDSPSNNTANYRAYLKKLVRNNKIEVVCEHKADLKYVEVGAASILAKVIRDDAIEEIKKKIDAVYSLDSELHPLKEVINKAGLENNYFNNEMVKGLYFRHSETLKQAIGEKDYMAVMENVHQANLKEVRKDLSKKLFNGLDVDQHGKGIVDYIQDKYKFDEKKVSRDRLEAEAGDLLINHLNKELSKDKIHRQYKSHKKK